MKSHEFIIQEGIVDWVKRTGIAGKNQKLMALDRQEQQRNYQFGLNNFITKFKLALRTVDANVEEFIKNYIGGQVKNYVVPQNEKDLLLNQLIPNFVNNYDLSTKQVGKQQTDDISKFWDWIWRVGNSQARDPSRKDKLIPGNNTGIEPATLNPADEFPDITKYDALRTATPGLPSNPELNSMTGAVYVFDFTTETWMKQVIVRGSRAPRFTPITDDIMIKALNKAYHTKYNI